MSSQLHTCGCSLHLALAARRHACYRQLANAILGPAAPREDHALALALAEHAQSSQPAKVTPIRRSRAA
jgi:hypothetical protein